MSTSYKWLRGRAFSNLCTANLRLYNLGFNICLRVVYILLLRSMTFSNVCQHLRRQSPDLTIGFRQQLLFLNH